MPSKATPIEYDFVTRVTDSEFYQEQRAKDSWFQHLAMDVPGEGGRTEWCEAVDEEQYSTLK